MQEKAKTFLKNNWWFILLILLIILGERSVGTAIVKGSSMESTYSNNDLLLVHRTSKVKVGDIVAIWSDDLNEYLCKRVIGVGGDNIVITGGNLYRNHEKITEIYINEQEWGSETDTALIVPDNEVYVMGDNRNHSTDSRELGTISINNIYGVSICNLTKTFGIKADAAKRFVKILIVILVGYLIIANIFTQKGKTKQNNDIEAENIVKTEEVLTITENSSDIDENFNKDKENYL